MNDYLDHDYRPEITARVAGSGWHACLLNRDRTRIDRCAILLSTTDDVYVNDGAWHHWVSDLVRKNGVTFLGSWHPRIRPEPLEFERYARWRGTHREIKRKRAWKPLPKKLAAEFIERYAQTPGERNAAA